MLKSFLEPRLNRTWYGDRRPGWLLRLLEPVYARGFDKRRSRAMSNIPGDLIGKAIVVVGNITVGGTGKTPLVIRLCRLLLEAGIKPAVVSRGYGRQGDRLVLINDSVPVDESGDEPRLIMQRTGVDVVVCRDRNEAARYLFGRGADVIISDDGLQRADFPRGYEICVIDGDRGLGNGRLLPAGPLRESADRLSSVDAIVVNGGNTSPRLPGAAGDKAIGMHLQARHVESLDTQRQLSVDEWVSMPGSGRVFAVAGIGHPERFFGTLTELGISFEERAFPDHHTYTAADFSDIQHERILMTEKDAVKCRQLQLTDAWCLPVTACLPDDWEHAFTERIRQLIEIPDKP